MLKIFFTKFQYCCKIFAMRVIAGKYKGMTLTAPSGEARPTLDRTKETLFNILNFAAKRSGIGFVCRFGTVGYREFEQRRKKWFYATITPCRLPRLSGIF